MLKFKRIAGIEEAGRGPVIGPMVLAIISCLEDKLPELIDMGVDDSKKLSRKKRENIFPELVKFDYISEIISPSQIDEALFSTKTNLNWLEADISAQLLNRMNEKIPIDEAIIDCPSPNIQAFTERVVEQVKNKQTKIICEHKADLKYKIVGAASIIAKVIRDREIDKIKEKIHYDFGSGYPSDPKTIAFIKKHYKDYEIFRKSWSTYQKVVKRKNQKTLF